MYPENAFLLQDNQTDILPPFGVRDEIKQEFADKTEALPNNIAPVPVHVQIEKFDGFNPNSKCKNLGYWLHHYEHDSYVSETLTEVYKEHVGAYKAHFGIEKDNFNARDEIDSSDPVYSHWYDRRPNDLSEAFLSEMMNLRRDYFKHGHCAVDWMPKLYTAEAFETLYNELSNAAEHPDEEGRRKFFYWSDHDTGMQHFACVMEYWFEIYIPFDTQFLFELWQDGDGALTVSMKVNGQVQAMPDGCADKLNCSVEEFKSMIKKQTFAFD